MRHRVQGTQFSAPPQTVKKVADKLAGCNEGRSALHLKSAGGGMYVAEERQNAASSIIFWP